MKPLLPTGGFMYTYAYHQDEKDLCQLEMRAFFGKIADSDHRTERPYDRTSRIHDHRPLHRQKLLFLLETLVCEKTKAQHAIA